MFILNLTVVPQIFNDMNEKCIYLLNTVESCIKIPGGSIFVVFMGNPHPRIYILNKTNNGRFSFPTET